MAVRLTNPRNDGEKNPEKNPRQNGHRPFSAGVCGKLISAGGADEDQRGDLVPGGVITVLRTYSVHSSTGNNRTGSTAVLE